MMENSEVLYIGGFELPDKNAAAQRVIANGKILRELGYTVYYLGLDHNLGTKAPLMQSATEFDGFNCFSVKYPSKLSEWFSYLFGVRNIVKVMDDLPALDVIVAYNYPAPALAKLRKLCRKRNVSLIADCTEWYEPQGGLVFKVIKGFDTYLRMKVIHPKLDGMIAISKYLYGFYKARMVDVVQIPPLVDSLSDKWQNTYIPNREELVLVYAGSPGKGAKDRIDTIIKALSVIKAASNVKFLLNVIGLSKQQYLDDFGKELLTSDIEPDVIFKGRLSHICTLNEVKNADYAIFVRDNNRVNTAGFPTKFVEALSCGTPVLTNAHSDVFDYIIDGTNGYKLDTTTEESMVKTLSFALSQSKKKIEEMKGIIRNENAFDYRKYVETFGSFLKSVTDLKDKR